ncbi:Copper type II ascorbate-dependent monooxygenase C-terminal [Trinorchestia longiramus]|nr:Copper type II ascorbate-dependent monooxygenase C-terminal [Trinorchestia longiramus]
MRRLNGTTKNEETKIVVIPNMVLIGDSTIKGQKTASKRGDCGHHGVCQGGQIMYAWAKNAPSTSLPQGVGFRVGGASPVRYFTLQIHYAVALPNVADHSGLRMELTTTPQQYKAGILLMVDGMTFIPAFAPKIHADIACAAKEAGVPVDIHVFGYRVHTHSLGVVVSGYKYDTKASPPSLKIRII